MVMPLVCSVSVMSLSPKRKSIQRMRYVTLAQESPFSYLGFDPIDKVFKVVSPIAGRSPYGCIHNIFDIRNFRSEVEEDPMFLIP